MTRWTHRLALVAAVVSIGVACRKVPYTERRQYNLVPDGIMRALGRTTYSQMLSGKRVARNGQPSEALSRVGKRISAVADQPKFDWKFSMIEENTVNAWCLPGGYIGFYTGILPVLKNEAGMAFVMGHEVAHATARHGSERVSQQMTLLGGLAGLNAYLSGNSDLSPEQRGVLMGAIGVGAEVGVMLPFSRSHESEADVIGLMYMSGAGYPPAESIKVWDRMGEAGGISPPAFLSTHPTNEKRQAVLREWMPKAKKRYQRNKRAGDMLKPIW